MKNHSGAASQYPLPTEPPAASPVHDPELATVEEHILPNGLRVLLVPDDRLPRYSLRLGMECGRQDNPEFNLALASLAVEMLQEGTERHDSRQLAELLDRWAIQLNSEVNLEFSTISMSALEDHLDHALDLLSELVLHPSFPDSELEKVKVRWHSNLVAQRAQPAFLAREAAFNAHFSGHPYSRCEIPIPDLSQATRRQVLDFYSANVAPARVCLLFAGPIDMERAAAMAEGFFGAWQQSAKARLEVSKPSPGESPKVRLIHRPFSVQSRIQVSGEAPPRTHPDTLLFRLTNQVFGGGGSSRIFLNLRERNGYTYGAYSLIHSFQQGSLFLASADVGVDVTASALLELLGEIGQIREQEPEEKELERSREELIGGLIRRLETAASVGALEVRRRLSGLPEDFYATYVPRLRSFSAEQVLECARSWFDPYKCLITVVGDRDKIEPQLEEFGEVEVFDTENNRLV